MKNYSFYYCGKRITRVEFQDNVPHNWEELVIGSEYSYGYYHAIQELEPCE